MDLILVLNVQEELKLTWMFYFVQNQSSPRRSKSIKHKNGESIVCFYLTGVNVCTGSGLSSPTDSYWHLQVKAHHTLALEGKPFRFTGNCFMSTCCWVPIIFCKSNIDDFFFLLLSVGAGPTGMFFSPGELGSSISSEPYKVTNPLLVFVVAPSGVTQWTV